MTKPLSTPHIPAFLLAGIIHGLALMMLGNPLPSIRPGKPHTLEVDLSVIPRPAPARVMHPPESGPPTGQPAAIKPPVSKPVQLPRTPEKKPVHRLPDKSVDKPAPPLTAASSRARPAEPPPLKRLTADLLGQQISQVSYEMSRPARNGGETPGKTAIENLKLPKYKTAAYEQAWQNKVERIGNLNYPEVARKRRLSGTLKLSVSLKADGSLLNVSIRRSSGHAELDEAAANIVRLAAPYARFPEEIRAETDVLVITRTWQFLDDFRLQTTP